MSDEADLDEVIAHAEREREGADFVRESNRIEGIRREPAQAEIEEFHRFLALDEITIAELERFVSVYQPNARLRAATGLNVRVGERLAPLGGPAIGYALEEILARANVCNGKYRERLRQAYAVHLAYEQLHPFTDGNGRSGRMLWRWMLPRAPFGFLRQFYYSALDAAETPAGKAVRP